MKYTTSDEATDKSTYPVLNYIKAPAFLFILQLITEHTRTGSLSFETVVYAFGAVGVYYFLIHFYEYIFEDIIRKAVPDRIIKKLKIGVITFFIVISLIIYLWI